MINGLFAGVKTLIWASMLICFGIFVMACTLTALAGKDSTPDETLGVLEKRELFGTIPRSMFTSFTCLFEGCAAINGSPISVHLFRRYGIRFALPYVTYQIFITFGVFNVIIAVFVETTLMAARSTNDALEVARESESERVANRLKELIRKLYTSNEVSSRISDDGKAERMTRASVAAKELEFEYEIDRETFERVMNEESVIELLDQLNIDEGDRNGLFDALDSDGSGGLSIEELINGILMIRGNFKKSDTVATRLAVKSVQKMVRNCRLQLLQQVIDMRMDLQASAASHRYAHGYAYGPQLPSAASAASHDMGRILSPEAMVQL